jgi:hypothetical protein
MAAITAHRRLFAVVAGGSVDREAEAELRAAAEARGGQVVRTSIGDSDPAQHFIDNVLPELEAAIHGHVNRASAPPSNGSGPRHRRDSSSRRGCGAASSTSPTSASRQRNSSAPLSGDLDTALAGSTRRWAGAATGLLRACGRPRASSRRTGPAATRVAPCGSARRSPLSRAMPAPAAGDR